MKILKLKLENFQGLPHQEFDFGGHSVSIFGDNGTGKTSVFNAITWLLFDKASTGAKNYSPKTTDTHCLEHIAEAVFQADSGRIITLKKVYREVYKKKRGTATEEFSGHTTDYYVDSVPSSENEYTATLLNFCGGIEKMKMLTMPNYFPEEMTWEARRKILLEMCGDVSDEDVINGKQELQELNSYLLMPGTDNQYYTVDEYKKIATSKMADINKQLQFIPNRVDEAQRAIPDVSNLNLERINGRIQELQANKEQLEKEKLQILSGDTAGSELRKQIAELQAQGLEAKAKHLKDNQDKNMDLHENIAEANGQITKYDDKIRESERNRIREEDRLTRLQNLRKELTEEFKQISAEKWDDKKSICPTCKRELPEADIEKMKEEFNLSRSQKLEAINTKGKEQASKEMIAESQKKIEELNQYYTNVFDEKESIKKYIDDIRTKIVRVTPFEETPQYADFTSKIQELKDQEQKKYTDNQTLASDVTNKILQVQEDIKAQQDLRARFSLADVQIKRIEALIQEEKDLAEQYQNFQKSIYLCEMFIRTKVSMLDEKINGKFQNVRFRLFIEQVNGGLKEDCEVLVPADGGRLIPYSFANNAARINAGLEIINVLSKHWNITMPVCIDNAESVTKLINMDAQVIRLVVPAPYESIVSKPTPDMIDFEYRLQKWEEAKSEYESKNKKLRLELN